MLDRRDEFGALARGLLSMTLRAEAQMAATQAARAESQRVFETAADGMVIATADGMIEGFNRAAEKMFGWTAGEVMDRDWSMLVAAAGAPTLDQSLNLAEGGSVDGAADAGGYRRAPSHTVQALRRDGTPFPAALRITVLEARFRTRFLLTIRDLSNEVALELARSESAAKSRFLANMSHELRTPLNAVTLHAQMIADEADDSDNPVLMEGARQIQGAADHLLDLINGILDLARIQSGRLDLNPAPMDLGMFVDGLKTIGSALARKQGNAFVIETEGLPATVVLDRVRLRQCALNLISNAAKFTKHGTITLSLTLSPGTLRLRVSDTGVGMSAEELGRIFQMFEQANGYVHAAHGGSGVGLALTRTIVEMMDGSIAVESAPNEGSCFEIAVPLAALGSEAGAVAQAARAAQDAPACAVPATDGLAHPALSGQPAALPQPVGVQGAPDHPAPGVIGACTILIVEDDVTLLHAIARAVSQMGLLTELAETAEDARRYLETTVPDMVVLDLALPQARGEEIIRLMKADPRLTETPITVITALDLSRAHAMWLTAQCHAVLRKGDFDLADLTAELTDIVRVCGDTAQAGNAPDTAGRTAPKNERGRSDDTRAFG
jgi:PAS domain S-box-containing protein